MLYVKYSQSFKKIEKDLGRENHQHLATDTTWGWRERKKSKSNSVFWLRQLLFKTGLMSLGGVSLLWSCRVGSWNPFLLFPLLCFPSLSQLWSSPEASIFTLGTKFSFRNWKYFVTFFFFFNLSIKQFYLFSLESYAAVGLIFIYLAYFFPTGCRISTFYIKN